MDDATEVAQLLDRLFAVRTASSPRPRGRRGVGDDDDDGDGITANLRVIALQGTGWYRFTAALDDPTTAVPLLWTRPGLTLWEGFTAECPPNDVRVLRSENAKGEPVTPAVPAARMLADRPLTANRSHLVPPSCTGSRRTRSPTTTGPVWASQICLWLLTCRRVADRLDDAAALPTAPARQLRREAAGYRAEADRVQPLLVPCIEPWIEAAVAEISDAGRTPAPTPRGYRRVPVTPR